MRRTLVLGLFILAVTAPNAQARVVHWANGSGHTTFASENRTFAFTAREYDDGTDRGEAQIVNRDVPVKAHATIDCLRVMGNTAVLSGTIDRSDNPSIPAGARMLITVMDNGEGSGSPPDMISFASLIGAATDCNNAMLPPTQVVERGNVQVR